jgi:hypothetical protein
MRVRIALLAAVRRRTSSEVAAVACAFGGWHRGSVEVDRKNSDSDSHASAVGVEEITAAF